jgi:hypothetical protein
MPSESNPWRALGNACNDIAVAFVLFIVIAAAAVGLDLVVAELPRLGVSPDIVGTLKFAAFWLLRVDLVLLLCFVVRALWTLLKSLGTQ